MEVKRKGEREISELRGNCIVAQSGGATAVINQSLCGVIQEAQKHREIEEIYGARDGILGLLKEELIDLRKEKASAIDNLKTIPGAALGSCRYRLRSWSESKKDLEKIIDDSMDTANKVDEAAKRMNYQLKVIGIPKTIDNDLVLTDHCPGFASAAKYLAVSVMEAGRHLESLYNSETVVILETLGRNTGWLAGSCALAKRSKEDAPHLIYFPEIPFFLDRFIKDVKEKRVPLRWINKKGNFVTKQFIDYIRPLIQGEVDIPIQNGLPCYPRLEKRRILAKK